MRKARLRTIVLASLLALCGCGTTHFEQVDWETRVQRPSPGASLIYFVRPGPRHDQGGAIIMDGDAYIGALPKWGHIAYVTTPGKHLFAVVSEEESADFMAADLEPGKTYYASVRERMGVWRSRYSFVGHNEPHPIASAQELVNTTRQLRANEDGRKWFEQNSARIRVLRERFYRVWETNKSKQVLTAAAGR